MARLKDRKTGKVVEIEMKTWQDDQGRYTEDWSNDFFEVGGLEQDEEDDTLYLVDDVDYCIAEAKDWENARGDYAVGPDCDENIENRTVFVTKA